MRGSSARVEPLAASPDAETSSSYRRRRDDLGVKGGSKRGAASPEGPEKDEYAGRSGRDFGMRSGAKWVVVWVVVVTVVVVVAGPRWRRA